MAESGVGQLLEQALAHQRAGETWEAETLCRRVLEAEPEHADALHLSGLLAHQDGRHEAAIGQLRLAMRRQPANPMLLNNLGAALRAAGDTAEAERALRRALAIHPAYAAGLETLAGILRDQGRRAEAAEIARRLCELEPGAAGAWNLLGILLQEAGDPAAAGEAYAQALTLCPDFTAALVNRAAALVATGGPTEARALLAEALAQDPAFAPAHNQLGALLHGHVELEEEAAHYRRALESDPDFADAWNNLGLVHRERGRDADAEAAWRRALTLDPGSPEPHYNLAIALFREEDPGPAARELDLALEIDPGHLKARFFRGLAADLAGNAGLAETCFAQLPREGEGEHFLVESWHYARARRGPVTRITTDAFALLRLGLEAAPSEGLVLEFGVRFGTSIRCLAGLTGQKIHGFDSFEGLPEAWGDNPAGSYSTGGALPEVPETVELHVGWFADSLPDFLERQSGPLRFANVDCDLYSSTRCVLEALAGRIVTGSVLVFDEYFCNGSWREDEFRAFQEMVAERGWRYEYLAFNPHSKQAAVRIL